MSGSAQPPLFTNDAGASARRDGVVDSDAPARHDAEQRKGVEAGPPPAPEAEQRAVVGADLLAGLNADQRAAVTHDGGPCLVLAGAGSGKTRVLTHRIAWLIGERGVASDRISAVTFTNKAAAEMRLRVRQLLGAHPEGLWLSTFHALGLHLLRQAAGRPDAPRRGFAVYDRDSALGVWRRCQSELRISAREHDPARLFGRCSHAVNRLEDPASWDDPGQGWERRIAGRVWKAYRTALEEIGAVDFDDLLHRPLRLLQLDSEVREAWRGRFRHILVDEYQDTNRIQYRLVRALLAEGDELMVVGDEDQSIYRWRGAELANVLDFQSDFPGATVVRLEQNYRSTQPILSAAGSLVAHNRQRLGKSLWTEAEGGDKPAYVQCATDRDEAEWVAGKLEELTGGGLDAGAAAVLYRTNAQSRRFEEVFLARRIPYRVVGGLRFFARREVRDVLAWLRLLVRPDDEALRRAVSAPNRGVGKVTLAALAAADPRHGAAATLERLGSGPGAAEALQQAGCPTAAVAPLLELHAVLAALRVVAERVALPQLVDAVVERSGYGRWLADEPDGAERLANLDELVTAATESMAAAEGTGLERLVAFLDRTTLLGDADSVRGADRGVSLTTVHAAKGLEFDAVFLTGMEEEVFPHASALADGQLEEERRLCYVGMTRARRHLFLSAAHSRRMHGRERWQEPSRFIVEIDPRCIVVHDRPEHEARTTGEEGRRLDGDLGRRRQGNRRSPTGSGGQARYRGGGGRSGASTARPGRRPRRPGGELDRHLGGAEAARPRPGAAGRSRPAADEDLVVGARVHHPKFGSGKVTRRLGSGEGLKLHIRFDRAGTKTILARFGRLEIVG